MAVSKKNDIIIDGEQINYSERGKVLGLTITRTGITRHINDIKNRGQSALHKLLQFKNIPSNIKVYLIKAFVLPIIRYPTIPLATVSKSSIIKLQRIQNQALRFAFDEKYSYTKNIKTLHEEAKLEPINYFLYTQAQKIFRKMETPTFIQFNSITDNYEDHLNHSWFKKKRKKGYLI